MEDNESKIFGVTLRGWLAFMLLYTVCVMSVTGIAVGSPLNELALLGAGFYFGQKSK